MLKIAILPLDIAWGDKKENFYQLRRGLETLPAGTDIVVLPELFSTGYTADTMHLNELSEDNNGATVALLHQLAGDYNVAMAGSFLARDGEGDFYNRAFFIEPGGDAAFYDKRHLFGPSNEASLFTAGSERPAIVRFRGWNVATIVCYDLRFPAWCYNYEGLKGYDVLLVPANWGVSRRWAWDHLLAARAIENQAYVVGANRSGSDDYGSYDDMAEAFDPMGKLCSTKQDGTTWVIAELDKASIEKARKHIPSLATPDRYTFDN